jgi:hypothetical protein
MFQQQYAMDSTSTLFSISHIINPWRIVVFIPGYFVERTEGTVSKDTVPWRELCVHYVGACDKCECVRGLFFFNVLSRFATDALYSCSCLKAGRLERTALARTDRSFITFNERRRNAFFKVFLREATVMQSSQPHNCLCVSVAGQSSLGKSFRSVVSDMIIDPFSSNAPAKPPLLTGSSISLCHSRTGISSNNLPTRSFSPVTLFFTNSVSLVIGEGRTFGCSLTQIYIFFL